MTVSQDVLDRNPEYAALLKKQKRVTPAADRQYGEYESGLEKRYAQNLAITCGASRPWHYHKLVFILADGTRYTPDFDYLAEDDVTCVVETKGSKKQKNARDSHTRWRVAAEMYPQFRWQWVEDVDGEPTVIEQRGR